MGAYTTRKRQLYKKSRPWTSTFNDGSGNVTATAGNYYVHGKQETVSADTSWSQVQKTINTYRRRHAALSKTKAGSKNRRMSTSERNQRLLAYERNIARLRDLDVGSAFTTVRHKYSESHPRIYFGSRPKPNRPNAQYTGPIAAYIREVDASASVYPPAYTPSDEELFAAGGTAVSRTIPTNPVSGAATFLGELREGLPQLPGRALFKAALKDYRKVGDEYLNYNFGIAPIVKDLQKFADTVNKSDKLIKQYERDSGRNVRRRYQFPITTTTEIQDLGTRSAAIPINAWGYDYGSSQGRLVLTIHRTKRIWFSGAYTYRLDVGDSARAKFARDVAIADKLYGTRITPEVLWNLAPWSWAADYLANTGDVIHNLSRLANDSLVMRYGYIMCESTISYTYTMTGLASEITGPLGPVSQTFTTISKTRRPASPYGFGANYDGFTPQQLSIIAALGISRGPRLG